MKFSKLMGTISVLALGAVAVSGPSQAQAPAQAPAQGQSRPAGQARPQPPAGGFGGAPIMHTLKEGKVYWAIAGASVGFVIGDKGVIMIDNGFAGADKIIQSVTNKPVTHVIETHDDTDHINGLYTTPNADKIKIIAMEDNWKQQWTSFKWTEKPKATCPQSPMPPAPNVIIRQPRVATTIDGVKFVFHHFGPSHTGHDLIIELPDYKIAFIGDVAFEADLFPDHPGLPPQDQGMFWKSEKRGTPVGMFHNVDELLKLNVDTYVGGHGLTTLTKAQLKQKRDLVKADYDKQAAMVRNGMSLDDLRKAVGEDKYGARGGCIAYVDLPWYVYNETKRNMEELKDKGTIKN